MQILHEWVHITVPVFHRPKCYSHLAQRNKQNHMEVLLNSKEDHSTVIKTYLQICPVAIIVVSNWYIFDKNIVFS